MLRRTLALPRTAAVAVLATTLLGAPGLAPVAAAQGEDPAAAGPTLPVTAPAGPAGGAQDGAAGDAAADDQIDRSDWPVLRPVRIEGEAVERAQATLDAYGVAPLEVSTDELRRALVYLVGSKELRSFKLSIEIEAEMERQIAAGRDPADFEVAEDEVRKVIEQTVEQVRAQYPTLDPADVLRLNGIHLGNLERMTRQSRLFTLVFLPEDPADWPPITVEAVRKGGQGAFFDQIVQSFADLERRIEAGEMTEEQIAQARQGQQTMRQLMGQVVVQELNASSVVETAADGLPPSVAMRVNGRDVSTDRVFDEIADRVSAADLALAERWLTKCRLLERALASRGYLLDAGGAAAAYDEHMAPMRGTMFPPEFFVVQVKGFPSMELYEEYYRYYASFQRMIEAELTEDVLQAHFDARANDLLNVARIGTEVILLSAYDFQRGLWKEDGWADAERRAREVAQRLLESGAANWGELQDEYSDFWDPPTPTTPPQGQMPRRKNKGRFAPMARNEMLGELGESEFTLFVDGTSITDEICFHLEEGQIGGPWKGRLGYYIARVTARTRPQGSRTLADPDMRSMVVTDYVTMRFNAFAEELYSAATASE